MGEHLVLRSANKNFIIIQCFVFNMFPNLCRINLSHKQLCQRSPVHRTPAKICCGRRRRLSFGLGLDFLSKQMCHCWSVFSILAILRPRATKSGRPYGDGVMYVSSFICWADNGRIYQRLTLHFPRSFLCDHPFRCLTFICKVSNT